MGYIRHHSIIVTSWDGKSIKKAWAKAQDIFGSEMVSGNGMKTTKLEKRESSKTASAMPAGKGAKGAKLDMYE